MCNQQELFPPELTPLAKAVLRNKLFFPIPFKIVSDPLLSENDIVIEMVVKPAYPVKFIKCTFTINE